jgi:hypothetical protein
MDLIYSCQGNTITETFEIDNKYALVKVKDPRLELKEAEIENLGGFANLKILKVNLFQVLALDFILEGK